jgi:uroporphyrinogen decarboxylase
MRYVKPFDLIAMKEASAACPFNILHVCDYVAPYASYDAVRDFPGQVVNCNPKLIDRQLSLQDISRLFKRPYMGGMERTGILTTGTPEQIENEVRRVVKSAPRQFILGADCTVPDNTDWNRLRQAISVAHRIGG